MRKDDHRSATLALAGMLSAVVFAGTVNGTAKNDNLRGSAKADTINGKAGNDKLYGLAGNDKLIGGAGNDLLNGGPGADNLNCGGGQRQGKCRQLRPGAARTVRSCRGLTPPAFSIAGASVGEGNSRSGNAYIRRDALESGKKAASVNSRLRTDRPKRPTTTRAQVERLHSPRVKRARRSPSRSSADLQSSWTRR